MTFFDISFFLNVLFAFPLLSLPPILLVRVFVRFLLFITCEQISIQTYKYTISLSLPPSLPPAALPASPISNGGAL